MALAPMMTPEQMARLKMMTDARGLPADGFMGPMQPQLPTATPPAAVIEAAKRMSQPAGVGAVGPQMPPRTEMTPQMMERLQGPFWEVKKQIEDKMGQTRRSTDLVPEDVHLGAQERAMQLRSFKQQEQGLAEQIDAIKRLNRTPEQLDLSPLASLVDTWTGSNFAKSYKVPDRARQAQIESMGLQDKMLARQQQMTTDQLGLYKAQLGGYTQDQLLRNVLAATQGGDKPQKAGTAAGQAQQSSFAREYRQGLTKLNTDLNDAEAQYKIIDDALSSGSYASVNLTLAQLARRISGEKGVLTDPDIQRTMPRSLNGDVYKLLTYASGLTPDTPVPPEYTDTLKAMVGFAKKKDREKYLAQLKGHEENFRSDPHWQEGNQGAVTSAARKRAESFAPNAPPPPTMSEMFGEFVKAKASQPAPAPQASTPAAPASGPSMNDLFHQFSTQKKAK